MFMLQELHIYSDRIPDNPHFKQINHQLPKYCTPLHVTHLRCPHPIPTKLATNMSITLQYHMAFTLAAETWWKISTLSRKVFDLGYTHNIHREHIFLLVYNQRI